MFRHLVEHNLQPRHERTPFNRELRWVAQENYWRAMRYGRQGQFIGTHEQQPVTAEGWLAQLQGQFPVDTADAERSFLHARRILREGTSADRQLQCREHALADGKSAAQALQAVVEQVIRQGHTQR